ncbi:hypothetical protein GCM10010232_38310 [Streptomyces amakusaensis]|uniref:Uncharacterized protein n=1 Tax=Streptomyces amakusaensis TaxID=67271 RepID=A0ABW0AQF5_9ACTN
MQPEHCPFHRREDTCVPLARLLAQAGLLDPSPHAPATGGTAMDVPPVPPRPVTLALIAEHVNAWGRVVIDPTLPHTDITALEERSLRYTLQALWEAWPRPRAHVRAGAGPRRRVRCHVPVSLSGSGA